METEWQPSETAPKDGGWFFACQLPNPAFGGDPYYSVVQWRPWDGGDRNGDGFYTFAGPARFTHWMPLPDPPKGE